MQWPFSVLRFGSFFLFSLQPGSEKNFNVGRSRFRALHLSPPLGPDARREEHDPGLPLDYSNRSRVVRHADIWRHCDAVAGTRVGDGRVGEGVNGVAGGDAKETTIALRIPPEMCRTGLREVRKLPRQAPFRRQRDSQTIMLHATVPAQLTHVVDEYVMARGICAGRVVRGMAWRAVRYEYHRAEPRHGYIPVTARGRSRARCTNRSYPLPRCAGSCRCWMIRPSSPCRASVQRCDSLRSWNKRGDGQFE